VVGDCLDLIVVADAEDQRTVDVATCKGNEVELLVVFIFLVDAAADHDC
jgi:hypothetical protein